MFGLGIQACMYADVKIPHGGHISMLHRKLAEPNLVVRKAFFRSLFPLLSYEDGKCIHWQTNLYTSLLLVTNRDKIK